MRKLKIKPLKDKEIVKMLDYSALLYTFFLIPMIFKELFNVNEKDYVRFIEKGEKLPLNNELINNEYYPKLTNILNRYLGISKDIGDYRLKKILTNKKLQNTMYATIKIKKVDIMQYIIKEYITDKEVNNILLFLACYNQICNIIYNYEKEIVTHINKNEIKRIKTLLTQSAKTFSMILYDLCSYNSLVIDNEKLEIIQKKIMGDLSDVIRCA